MWSTATMEIAKTAENAVAQAIERVSELLRHETTARMVRDDAEALRAELKKILNTFRRDDDGRSEVIEIQLKSLITVAYEVIDVVETSVVKPDAPSCAGAFRIGRRGGGLEARIKSCRSVIEGIMKELGGGGEGTSAAEMVMDEQGFENGNYHLDMHDDFIVGFEESVHFLREKLMEDDRLCAVWIVGMGGIGKTTLAKKVSGLREVRQHFDCFAWVFVSQRCDVKEILCEIIVQIGFMGQYNTKGVSGGSKREFLNDMDVDLLVYLIWRELKEKRYLVVLDDVWSVQSLNTIKRAFPNGKKGSKIMVTTRSRESEQFVDPERFEFMPKRLDKKESFELLAQKVFGQDLNCLSELQDVLMAIVDYCEGIPLLIILLGGLLRTKRSLAGLMEVLEHLRVYHVKDDGLFRLLAICYNDLPFHLTPCFLYLATFPENYEVSKQKLIQLWIAEGFIPNPRREKETLESIAEGYLRELIGRCMVQVVKRDHTGVGIKACQMHDHVHDFCIMVAEKSNFFDTLAPRGTADTTFARRVVVQDNSKLDRIQVSHPGTRSFLWFSLHDFDHPYLRSWRNIMKNFRLLRVLELRLITSYKLKLTGEVGNLIYLRYLGLSGVFIFELPNSIGNLRYLEILDLRNTGITKLPRSIGKLQSLHTLDLRGNELSSLPKTMSRLTCLRHLMLPTLQSYGPASAVLTRSCFRIDKLKNLQTLKFVQAMTLIRFDAVLRLTNIQNLKIEFRSSQEVRAVLASPITGLKRLQLLHMSLLSQDTFPSLESLSRCYNISKLGLHGTLSDEDLQFLPPNINKLLLSKSSLKQDPMAVLQEMRNLRFLLLGKNSYNGLEMACLAHGFPKLMTLKLVGLSKLQEWRVEEGSMPSLETLDIENVSKLRILPEELKSLPSLRDLNITEVRETSGEEPGVVDSAGGENLAPARKRLRPAPSFLGHVSNMPPTISVHLIVAEISSASGC